MSFTRAASTASLTILLVATGFAADETPHFQSFDEQIAPLFAARCLSCHDADNKKGGLILSRKEAALAGGESGAAILPGEIDKSPLWQRIAADEMPPKQPLSSAEKALIRDWIATGASWGLDPIDPFRFSTDHRAGYDWWSLRPIGDSDPPAVNQQDWQRNEIDAFVLAKLELRGLKPAPEASPRSLVRRLFFDLTGLPPTVDEWERWTVELTQANRDDVYARLVDQLLASSHYGERWARHWLDVVRFGESQGFERNRIRENAWRYRDWVVRAFNNDLPYDEFVRQQIAGDVLYPDDLDALLATGFLVCGTWDQVGHTEGSAEMRVAARYDHLEDLVGTVGQTFLALTTQCARCHDHKFDPISQREYYQLAAAVAGVQQEEKERSNIPLRNDSDAVRQWQLRLAALRAARGDLETGLRQKYSSTPGVFTRPGGLQVAYVFHQGGREVSSVAAEDDSLKLQQGEQPRWATASPATGLIDAVKHSGEFTIEAWLTPANVSQKGPARIVTLSQDTSQRNFTLGQEGHRFDVRFRTTKTDGNGLPSLAGPATIKAGQRTHVAFTLTRSGMAKLYLDGQTAASHELGGELSNWNDAFRLGFGNEFTGDRPWDGSIELVALYAKALSPEQVASHFADGSAAVRGGESFRTVLGRATSQEQERYSHVSSELVQLEQSPPLTPFEGVAHVVIPRQPPVLHVLQRGDFRKPGDVVSPAGLAALGTGNLSADFGLAPDAPEEKRRVALAKWITDPQNPLTARVFVNRLWHYHLGIGIVDTPSDFGFSGGRPSHPELLDWLAQRFVRGGWKIKDLQRLIVTSSTYRQSSIVENPKALEVDAENHLLWRANSRRLEGEEIRDAMLLLSGTLNPLVGGPSYRDLKIKLATNHEFTDPTGEFSEAVNRRTIYRLWARCGNLPMLEALDCPDPSVAVPRRLQTITPVQSLSLLNGSFVENCSARLSDQIRHTGQPDDSAQVAAAYRAILGRTQQAQELDKARAFVASHGLTELCIVLFNTNEFSFVE